MFQHRRHHFIAFTGLFFIIMVLCFSSSQLFADTLFISKGATWKYLDNGSDQGISWRENTFDDSSWQSGAAILGYGNGGEATVVSYGGDAANKYITTYFRHQFSVTNPAQYQSLSLELLRDDGAVVYLNGSELVRDNMPAGTINYLTVASSTIGGAAETTYQQFSFPATALQAGTNTLAIEIHQRSRSSSDIGMDVSLTGLTAAAPVTITRGPYLQMGSHNAMTLRWRTNIPTDSRVQYGTSVGNLNNTVDRGVQTTEHEIRLTGLTAQTVYFYSVGQSGGVLASGPDYYFRTSPMPGSRTPARIWVIGDSGTANNNARAVYTAYRNLTGSTYTDLWLMLGDNAYNSGTDSQYQSAVFDIYPELLRQTPLWSTLGNHDGYSASSANETGPYYSIFTLPRQAEVGGLVSGTEAYYSFDYSNIHFIVLDSYETMQSVANRDTMLQWMEADLQNTSADWIIAFWHHPPYSKGSHDSDTETRLIDMRAVALPILENYGVDLVLSGHSHAYERSLFIDSHYGLSGTLTAANIIDAGSGRVDDTGAYHKQVVGSNHAGAVFVVAGSSGKISGGALNHSAMYLSLNELGSLVLDVDGLTLNARFINNAGATKDYFTLTKGSDSDSDGIPDDTDNCPTQANPRQSDSNTDGVGDLCTPYVLPDNSWRQISMPANLGALNTMADVFADDLPAAQLGVLWTVYRYNPASNSYYMVALDDTLQAGEGYWALQKTGANVNIDLPTGIQETTASGTYSQCSSATGCYVQVLPTQAGDTQWSMPGYPFEFTTSLSAARIVTDSGVCADIDGCTLDEAAAANILNKELFRYNGTSYDRLGSGHVLTGWSGVWAATLAGADGLNPRLLLPLP